MLQEPGSERDVVGRYSPPKKGTQRSPLPAYLEDLG